MKSRTGQLSNRNHGYGYGSKGISKAKQSSPLRKIVQVLIAYNNIFVQNRVLLECGHETNSNAIYRAHCEECKKKKEWGTDNGKQ